MAGAGHGVRHRTPMAGQQPPALVTRPRAVYSIYTLYTAARGCAADLDFIILSSTAFIATAVTVIATALTAAAAFFATALTAPVPLGNKDHEFP